MRVTILGGTGFIGSYLSYTLARSGFDVEVLTRNPQVGTVIFNHPKIFCSPWNGTSVIDLIPFVEGADIVINLLGEGIATKRWTIHRKREILQSRILATSALAKAIGMVYRKPKVVVQGSAVGFYGYEYLGTDAADEFSEKGRGFLAEVCEKWEDAILPVENLVGRLIVVRTGIVLGAGGFLDKISIPFKLGMGGKLGDGLHPFPWIHLEDVAAAILFLIKCEAANGVYNLVAPEYACYTDFVKAFGVALKRPTIIGIPAFMVKILFGEELAKEVLLGGREVLPQRLLQLGYEFKHPSLEETLLSIVNRDL